MSRRFVLIVVTIGAASTALLAQNPAAVGPQFDVVSIKQNVSGPPTGPPIVRPDGGFTMISVPIGSLIGRAYGTAPADMVGLPDWAMREHYDVRTTSTLTNATAEDRAAMIRAMSPIGASCWCISNRVSTTRTNWYSRAGMASSDPGSRNPIRTAASLLQREQGVPIWTHHRRPARRDW